MVKKKPKWKYPSISLLKESFPPIKDDEGKKVGKTVQKVFDNFNVKTQVVNHFSGPNTINLHLKLGKGVKMSEVTKLRDEIIRAINVYTKDIVFSKFVPGTPYIGLEIPRKKGQKVSLKSMLKTKELKNHKDKLAIPLGLDVFGKEGISEIDKMPHVLITGSTGSGKSAFLNSIISTLLYRTTSQEVKFILVDPKRVELTLYNNMPHLLTPIILEPEKAISALKWVNFEMERRYEVFAKTDAKNISSYNKLSGVKLLPYIIIIIDELADIILFAPSKVENSIISLAQMAQATGIHLIMATSRPSDNVLTGQIKANINCRVAFNVYSKVDSKVILDTEGAEKLQGKGDMLYYSPDKFKIVRFQTPYISMKEILNIIKDIKKNNPESPEELEYKKFITSSNEKDELYEKAVKIVRQYDNASASLIQRRLMIGYARAARLIDMLELKGIIGPAEGAMPREVFNSKPNKLKNKKR